jgi:hypothetical protein
MIRRGDGGGMGGQRSRRSLREEVLCSMSEENSSVRKLQHESEELRNSDAYCRKLEPFEILTSTGAQKRFLDSRGANAIRDVYDAR